MKTRISLVFPAVLILLLTALQTSCTGRLQPSVTGTWKLDSYKYGDTDVFVPASDSRPRIKLITDSSFHWVSYDASTGRIVSSAGGHYTLEKDTYTETLVYGLGMNSYLGTVSIFRIKSDDDMLFISGDLSDGLHIEEVWQKTE